MARNGSDFGGLRVYGLQFFRASVFRICPKPPTIVSGHMPTLTPRVEDTVDDLRQEKAEGSANSSIEASGFRVYLDPKSR